MVRNRLRKTEKVILSDNSMREAVNLVTQGMSLRKAADQTGVHFSTLFRYVQKRKQKSDGEEIRMCPNYKVRQIFTNDQEKLLEEYIINSARIFYGLTNIEIRRVAYQMAHVNSIKCPEKWINEEMAGIEWLYGFMKRPPTLSIRTPEGCSLSRATSFNKHNVDIFFGNLRKVYNDNPAFSDGTRVYNLDETATTTVQKPPKVVAEKGIKQVNKCTSAERGVLVTTCCIINASGNTIPPVMVFPRVHIKNHMISGAPPGTLGLANPSGWMTKDLFYEVIKHFIKHTHSSKSHPTLLLLDNHESHLYIKALDLAKESGVTILTFPPHTTNKLQPLDVGVYKPFKTYYNQAVDSWMMRNPGKTISIYEIAECVNAAHEKAMNPATIKAAFKKTGIYPYDENVFSEIDFLSSSVTDRIHSGLNDTMGNEQDEANSPIPRTASKTESLFLSPAIFRGYPKSGERKLNKAGRRKGKSIIATSTPEKDAIAEREKGKVLKTKQKSVIRQIVQSSDESDDAGEEMEFQDSDTNEEFIQEMLAPNENNEFNDLERDPSKGDYVLVEFDAGKKKTIFYVGEIITTKDENNEFEIDFLRKSEKVTDHFYKPQVADVSIVPSSKIKQIMPKPTILGSTSRQKCYLRFGITFGCLNVH